MRSPALPIAALLAATLALGGRAEAVAHADGPAGDAEPDLGLVGTNPPPLPYFKLQAAGGEGAGKCLESNALVQSAFHGGASFLDRCRYVSGQAWRAEPVGAIGFHLFSEFHGTEACLRVSTGEIAGLAPGTPFMGLCETGAHAFEAMPAGPGTFHLRIVAADGVDAEDACLAALPTGEPFDTHVPVHAALCDGSEGQSWRIAHGRLEDGLPVSVREDGPPLQAPPGTVRVARCLWNDGVSDRADHYSCTVERSADGRRVVARGPGHAHAFVTEIDRPDVATGFLQVAGNSLRLGRFVRPRNDRACWVNADSGERLCIW